ncbi:hypothetical protein ASG81_23125 [Paenibacillus sp. Soil522]|nr:hypothetical protein ASG81_23125 [Paenibacillus sp. Soil522]
MVLIDGNYAVFSKGGESIKAFDLDQRSCDIILLYGMKPLPFTTILPVSHTCGASAAPQMMKMGRRICQYCYYGWERKVDKL